MSEREDREEHGSCADSRMADLLAGEPRSSPTIRRDLQDEGSDEADDLLARLNALDYLDTLVGEVGSDLPERLGEYRIIGLLGRGGMGTVFEAFQESLERVVALKVLVPSMTSDPRMRKRFRTEARASATLNHQHIVPVYGFGEASGFLYFAMERVEGVSLDKHVSAASRRGDPAMEPREAARRFAGVADALGHAHRRGVLHRDVKPGNILVHLDGTLALADFGLSKVVGEASLSVSKTGGFLGTLHYAAPEQARGRPVTAASDLYSLGVTIYESVTGRLPVRGETTEALLQALLHETPRSLRQLVPKAPRDLELVLEKLLSKEPEDRYSDGEALARDLLRVADDEPVQVRRRSIVVRAWRQVRKHRLLSAVMTVAVVLLLAVFALWQQFLGEERNARVSRHANRLTQAVSTAESEPGRLDGPRGVLEALLGIDLPEGPARSPVLDLLGEAERGLPDDPRTQELRVAYLEDPVPEATAALLEGRGAVALRLLDSEIAEAETLSGFAARDSVTWLRLYRLYLTRAVASLTAAVSDAEAAGKDLLRASFMRPGAFAPALLSALVEWRTDQQEGALFDAIDEVLKRAPAEARLAAAALLRAAAGFDRPVGANLMEFGLPYGVRRRLHARIAEIAPLRVEGPTTARAGRLEMVLEDCAHRGAAAFAQLPALRAALAPGRQLLDHEVAPGSPLQSWRVVFAMLESLDPLAVTLLDGSPIPTAMLARGVEDLLRIGLPSDVLRQRRDAVERVLDRATIDGVPAHRVRASFLVAVGEFEQASGAVELWMAAESEDPAAHLARMECRVAAGDTDGAGLDGLLAVQLAVSQDTFRRKVADVFRRAESSDAERADRWRELRESFESGG